MSHLRTQELDPIPPQYVYGWSAWEATVGEVARRLNADAVFKVRIYPMESVIGWEVSLTWGRYQEVISDCAVLGDALTPLWLAVSRHTSIKDLGLANRAPVGYSEDEWLDDATYRTLSNLVHLTDFSFLSNWEVVLLYRPLEVAGKRIAARLIGEQGHYSKGGYGVTLRACCRDLYKKALPVYIQAQQENL